MQRDIRISVPASISPAVVSAEAESQVPKAKPSTAVATTTVTEQQLLTALETLWVENKKNRFELGKTLFELQELYAVPGHGKFLEKVNALGIPKSTAYRLIKHYKDEAGLSQAETYDNTDDSDDQESADVLDTKQKTPKKVIVWLQSEQQKINWALALQMIAKVQEMNEHEAAFYAVMETANRLSEVDAGIEEATFPLGHLEPEMQDMEEL